ncbi:MAG: bifunctional DNA-formamidopyrimidine glycosylase/DNA-(apurinic or apyrimidinic site) lyase [Anaerolineae bacterium]|jgi:formamidopyrimidine-DNA glycosylase
MPELPEVENVARGLDRRLAGRTITRVSVSWSRNIAQPDLETFERSIVGRRVEAVWRRGKYIVMRLDSGYLLVHLKMSGRLQILSAEEPAGPHVRVVFGLDDGSELRFDNARKWGRIYLVHDVEDITGDLGPEPLSKAFSLEAFRDLLSGRSGQLKPLLLNQRFVAGLGNIYANEVLFAAGLHPQRRADTLSAQEQAALYRAIRSVLEEAIAAGGTTLSDGGFTDAEGRPGGFSQKLAVHGLEDEPCRACGTPVERLVIGGRSAFFCPRCQQDAA